MTSNNRVPDIITARNGPRNWLYILGINPTISNELTKFGCALLPITVSELGTGTCSNFRSLNPTTKRK